MKDKILIFTDGASKGNPGPGGWAAIVVIKSKVNNVESKEEIVLELGGREDHTTNNRMELMGALKALEEINKHAELAGEEITFFTDSKYLIGGMTNWLVNWQKNNWRTAQKKPVLNQDLWKTLAILAKDKKITWDYVAGHSGHDANERCDEIASNMAENLPVHLYDGPKANYSVKITG